jgi:hypothetical protein
MRTLLLLASLVIVAATVALVAVRDEGAAPTTQPPGAVTLVGDSLNVGIEPYLPAELERWKITNRNEVGRRTASGVEVLRDEGRALARHVVVSLGTNDSADDAAGFRRQVREALSIAGVARCVVWVNLAVSWESFAPLNDVLVEEASRVDNLRVVDWAALLEEHPDWLAADGVHGTEDGYRARARAVADAVRGCRVEPEAAPAP